MMTYSFEYDNYRKKTIELDLKECLWDYLEQWKLVLIVSVVFALIISAALGYRAKVNAEKTTAEKGTREEIMATLSKTDLQEVNYAIALRKKYYALNNYYSDSILMSLDTSNVQTLQCEWIIEGTEADAPLLFNEYKRELFSYENLKRIEEAIHVDIEIPYFKELFVVESDDQSVIIIREEGKNLFRCITFIPEGIDPSVLENNLIEMAEEVHNKINTQIAEHKFSLISSQIESGFSDILFSLQYQRQNALINLRNNYYNNIQQLSTIQKRAVDQSFGFANDADESTAKKSKKVSWLNLKYLIFGFVCGMLLYALALICYYTLRRKIISADMIRDSIGMKKIGEFYTHDFSGKSGRFLHDRRIFVLRHKYKLDLDTQLSIATKAITKDFNDLLTKSIKMISLYESDKGTLRIIDRLCSMLNKQGIQSTKAGLHDIDEFKLYEENGIVLVIPHNTNARIFETALEMLELYDIPLYGYIYAG